MGGRAEPIRALCAHANFKFTDQRVTGEEFAQIKAFNDLPMDAVPIWLENGLTICQTNAILRMLAIRLGYYVEDPETAYAIDSLCDFMDDLVPKFSAYLFPLTKGEPLGDPEAWLTEFWDKMISVVERRMNKHGKKFVAGTDRPTIADFKLFAPVSFATKVNTAC